MTIDREAILGPSDLDALRAVAAGMSAGISAYRANLLADMGFIEMDSTGALVLTETGRMRLARAAPLAPGAHQQEGQSALVEELQRSAETIKQVARFIAMLHRCGQVHPRLRS